MNCPIHGHPIMACEGCDAARADAIAAAVDTARSEARDVALAYLLDRRAQYQESSGTYAAIEELISGIARADHEAAHAHGEYDDILADRTVWPWVRKGDS